MNLCPATHPDTGAQCERWNQPAAHVVDGMHQAGDLKWPYITPHYADERVTVWAGDCLDVLRAMPAASAHAVVTDPPAAIAFMGRAWDGDKGGREQWVAWLAEVMREALRVVKPGGHALVWALPRTSHWTAWALEDAGWEVRDRISHLFGTGFPKSRNPALDSVFCQCDFGTAALTSDAPDLRGLRDILDAEGPLPGGAQSDVLDGVLGASVGGDSPRHREGASTCLHAMRGALQAQEPDGDESRQVLRPEVLRPVALDEPRGDSADEDCERCGGGGAAGQAARRTEGGEEPRLEGGCDLQAPEGQLRGSALCPLPSGVRGDVPGGWICDGTPPGDGAMDRPSIDASGVRESQGPQSPEQRAIEPGAVPDERGPQAGRGRPLCGRCGKPAPPAGLGTALKPAAEDWWVARRPLAGSVAANVVEHGTGALNIDGCRVEAAAGDYVHPGNDNRTQTGMYNHFDREGRQAPPNAAGRWPANVVLTHAPDCADPPGGCVFACPVAELDEQSGTTTSVGGSRGQGASRGVYEGGVLGAQPDLRPGLGDAGGASRFFPVFRWQAKANTAERPAVSGAGDEGRVTGLGGKIRRCLECGTQAIRSGETEPSCLHGRYEWVAPPTRGDIVAHETVKPLGLMRWLVRLVTPPGGTVLDMFAGSGTTGEAAILEGFPVILVEREARYLPLILARVTPYTSPQVLAAARGRGVRPARRPVAGAGDDLLSLLDSDAASAAPARLEAT